MFHPNSVAVVGASSNKLRPGYEIIKNLIKGGFAGSIFPVNPNAPEILGLKAYRSVNEITNKIDLAIIAVPAANVSPTIDECVKKKIQAIVIISAGFGEIGDIGTTAEKEFSERAAKYGIRIVGPNSAGIVASSSNLYATIEGIPPKGPVAFLSQSGAFGGAIFGWAQDLCLGFSKFVSLGNMCDVNFNDLLAYLAEDEDTKVVVMYVEGIKEGRRFISVARRVSAHKPIVAYKVGRTEAGRKAAISHTGAMTTSDRIYDAAFRQAGVIRAYDVEELLEYACVLTSQPLPKGGRVGILTDAGGPGVAAADACNVLGLEVPEISSPTQTELRRFLPSFASTRNPVDMTFTPDPQTYQTCIDLLLREAVIDGLIVTITSHVEVQEELANTIVRSSSKHEKPLLVSWTSGKMVDFAREILRRNGTPVYPTPDRAARAMACQVKYSNLLRGGVSLSSRVGDTNATDSDSFYSRSRISQSNYNNRT